MKITFLSFLAGVVLSSVLFMSAQVLAGTDRTQDLQRIRAFLHDEQITAAMEGTHKRDVEKMLQKIESLSDKNIAAIAAHTPDLLQFGGATYESKTAERVSTDWLGFADKWMTIGLVASIVLILLVL